MIDLRMAGIDFNTASIEIRERFALTASGQSEALRTIRCSRGVNGCAIISTCNRLELWISAEGSLTKSPMELLCTYFGVSNAEYEPFFTQRTGGEATLHLFELACGLKSLIFGEEQILTQVKEAIAFARDHKASDSILEAAFRHAVTAAKKARTGVHLKAVDRSAAGAAIQILKERFGDLKGLSCLVIGSGEMGRLSAGSLVAEGCDVTITLRHHGSCEADVPVGCHVVDYEVRYSVLETAKVVFSATRSPHYTLTDDRVRELVGNDEMVLFDLAVPRDIEPSIAQLPGVTLYDIDHLGGNLASAPDNESVREIRAVITDEMHELERWDTARALMPKIHAISAAAAVDVKERIQYSTGHIALDEQSQRLIHEAAEKAVSKVVDNILLTLHKTMGSDFMGGFLSNPVADEKEAPQLPPRFPMFVDLSGRNIAVIGAGTIALRRIRALLSYPCTITVTAPEVHEEIEELHKDGRIILRKKAYEPADLEGAYIVIAATDNRAINHQIAIDAGTYGLHRSIADCKEECTFYFPATIHYDGGVIGICGTGDDHGRTKDLTADIREFIKAKDTI